MKLLKSFGFAWAGIVTAIKEQKNLRIHLVAMLLVIVSAVYFQVEIWEWCALMLCCALVLVTETINTAIEYLTNIASPQWQETAGKVKDIAAAAVLVSAFFSAVIAVLIFKKYIFL